MPSKKILSVYKKAFNNSKFYLYLYDSLNNISNISEKFPYFDNISSFDKKDCSNNKILKFKPLFYCDEYYRKTNNQSYKYDLCFIGTIHSDRYKILKMVKKEAEDNGLNMFFYPYLQSKFIYYFYKIFKPEFRNSKISDFKFNKLSSKTISKIIDESNVIIDIQHPKQTGLTMRTIEILGLRKKLITTNKDIQNYDFYNKNNIMIVDRNQFIISRDFFNKQYINLNNEIYEKYSLGSWVST